MKENPHPQQVGERTLRKVTDDKWKIVPVKHRAGCPQKDDFGDECMCDYIAEHRQAKNKKRVTRATSPAQVRRIALEIAGLQSFNGSSRFKRVSAKFLEAVERNAWEFMRKRIAAQDRKGMTLM